MGFFSSLQSTADWANTQDLQRDPESGATTNYSGAPISIPLWQRGGAPTFSDDVWRRLGFNGPLSSTEQGRDADGNVADVPVMSPELAKFIADNGYSGSQYTQGSSGINAILGRDNTPVYSQGFDNPSTASDGLSIAATVAPFFGGLAYDAYAAGAGVAAGSDAGAAGAAGYAGAASSDAAFGSALANSGGAGVATSGAAAAGTTGAAAGGAGGLSGSAWLQGGQALLGAAGSYYSSKVQQDAAKDAANATLAQNEQARADSAPWRIAGADAVGQLSAGTQPGGYFAHQFDANDLNANLAPNYAFSLDQGQRANQNAAGVSGGLVGGNALQGLDKWTQDYAQGAYQQAYNNYTSNQTNIFNRLSNIAGLGQTANQANTVSANSNVAGANNYLTSGAAANAAGVVGGVNATNNGLNNYLGWQYLNKP
jgi:hypothetical protein